MNEEPFYVVFIMALIFISTGIAGLYFFSLFAFTVGLCRLSDYFEEKRCYE